MHSRLDPFDPATSWGYLNLDLSRAAAGAHVRLRHAFDAAFAQAGAPYGANLWLAIDSCMGADFYLSPESTTLRRTLSPTYRIRICEAPVRPLIYIAGFRHGPAKARTRTKYSTDRPQRRLVSNRVALHHRHV